MPKGMMRSDRNTRKDAILNGEIDSVNRYLDQQALQRLQNYTASANKGDIEKRFNDIITRAMITIVIYCSLIEK